MRERNILTERETHLKRPSSIIYLYWSNYSQTKNYKLVRMLERYLTSGREASNNRRTMNREKSWRKTWEKIFFLSDTCSFWLVLPRYTLSAEYKRKKWKKKKRKKKRNIQGRCDLLWRETLRFEEKTKTFDFSASKKLYVYSSKNNAIRNKRNATNWTCSENMDLSVEFSQ